jgi:two-component system KDP operon response regulator KdpE
MPELETVLVVDDEAAIERALTAALEARGYRVLATTTGVDALDSDASESASIVILDLGLPDMDGIDVCRRIRQWSQVPIIVLTAEGADDRKVTALDEGADDYVTKPFSVPELLARVRVALRHRHNAGARLDESVFVVGDVRIDVARREVTVDDRAIDLTPKEFGFLAALARYPGRVISHRMILEEVWGRGYGTETQYLRVYASQLRKKLNEDPTRPRLITEPGVGYRLVDPADD